MKLAILTLPLSSHVRYGATLQAYALQTVLERMGHEVQVLDTDRKIAKPQLSKWNAIIYPFLLLRHKRRTKKSNEKFYFYAKNFRRFVQKHIHTYKINSLKDLKDRDFEGYVVGSDQVWKEKYFTINWDAKMRDAFLDFTKNWNVRRISYATSFGGSSLYRLSNKRSCYNAAANLDMVSVREMGSVSCFRRIVESANVVETLDAAMLLDKQDYLALVERDSSEMSKGKMVTSVQLYDEYMEYYVEESAQRLQLKIQFIMDPKIAHLPSDGTQPPIEAWLCAINGGDFVLTDSYDACLFSIIFNTPFAVLNRGIHGKERIVYLLRLFNLQNRIVSSPKELMALPEINWDEVNATREELKKKSLEFLERLEG